MKKSGRYTKERVNNEISRLVMIGFIEAEMVKGSNHEDRVDILKRVDSVRGGVESYPLTLEGLELLEK